MLEAFLGMCGGLGRKVLGVGVDERKREDTELRPDHVPSCRPMTSPYASPQSAAPAMLGFPDGGIRPSKQPNMPGEKRSHPTASAELSSSQCLDSPEAEEPIISWDQSPLRIRRLVLQ